MIQIKMALLEDYEREQDKIPARFRPYYTQDRTYVMHMREGDELLGVGSATTLPGERAQINDFLVFQDDPGLVDGLLRALLNFLDICGAKTVFCTQEALFPPLKLLGFTQLQADRDQTQSGPRETGAYMELSLVGFFDQHC